MSLLVFYNGTHFQDEFDETTVNINYLICVLVLSSLSAISCCAVVGSILCSKQARAQGFNLYLVFLLMPDICLCAWQIVTKILVLQNGARRFQFECVVGRMVSVAYCTINFWINVLVANDIYQMLKKPIARRDYKPVSSKTLICRVFIVYVLSLIVTIIFTFNTKPFMDLRIDPKECNTKGYDTQTILTGYCLTVFAFGLPPIYHTYVFCIVLKKKLLPPTGVNRFLSIYFLRIMFFSVFFTILGILTMFVRDSAFFLIFLVSQGMIVALMSFQKKDIRIAVRDAFFWCCNDSSDSCEVRHQTEDAVYLSKTSENL